ncbi:MAG: flagellar motor switch protein FliM [Synergistaceae bacterium]|nr:flagellar motor switch protein FliM [Synergistaceae bacterium]MBQ9596408.1 flagellar motor switch protein FliM [Synergistaceae bacterium]
MPDVLSQNDIDALLKSISSGADINAIAAKTDEYAKLKVYDFKRPDKFSKDQLRAIQMIHESFARQMTTVLSTLIRSIVSAEIASVEQLAYEEFVNYMVQPTVIGMIEMHPFEGSMLIEINPSLVFTIIDRMLGGRGTFSGNVRELTDIEKTVIERVIMRILELLEDSWSTVVDVRFRFESMESNPFFVQICSPSDMVLVVIMKLRVSDVEGMVSLCFPYFLMEPIMDRLSSQQWFASTSHKADDEVKTWLNNSVRQVKMPMAMELGHTVLSLNDVYALQVGDVIKLDELKDSNIDVRVGNQIRFKARPGTLNGHMAVELTSVLTDDLPMLTGSSQED